MAFLTDYRAVFPEDLNDHTMLDDHFLIDIEGHLFPEYVIVSRRPEGGRVEYRDYTPAPNERLKQLEAENDKLRERAVAMLSELRGVVSEGDYDSPSGRYFLLRRDVAAYEDALRELGIEVR